MAGLFAVFSGAPRVLLEGFGLSPVMLGLLFAGVVFLVFGSGDAGAETGGPARPVIARPWRAWGSAAVGGIALLLAVLGRQDTRCSRFSSPLPIFLVGLGIASPLSSAAALSPFGDKAGAAAALFGFSQMSGAACGAWLAVVLDSDPAVGLLAEWCWR